MVYVTRKIAELLKQLGYDEECNRFYYTNSDDHLHWIQRCIKNSDLSGAYVAAPPISEAIRWLQEEKHIFIGRDYEFDKELRQLNFLAPIKDMDTHRTITVIGAFSPQDVEIAALEWALDYITINKT